MLSVRQTSVVWRHRFPPLTLLLSSARCGINSVICLICTIDSNIIMVSNNIVSGSGERCEDWIQWNRMVPQLNSAQITWRPAPPEVSQNSVSTLVLIQTSLGRPRVIFFAPALLVSEIRWCSACRYLSQYFINWKLPSKDIYCSFVVFMDQKVIQKYFG